MSDWTPDQLKEYIDHEFDQVKRVLNLLEENKANISILEEKLRGIDKATLIQATEYERRLETLNHAHAEAQRILATYLPREAYEAYVKEQQRREEVKTKEEEAKAEQLRNSIIETRERLEVAVKELAISVEKTQKEAYARMEQQIDELKKDFQRREGSQQAISSTGKIMAATVGAVGTIITIVVLLANNTI